MSVLQPVTVIMQYCRAGDKHRTVKYAAEILLLCTEILLLALLLWTHTLERLMPSDIRKKKKSYDLQEGNEGLQ